MLAVVTCFFNFAGFDRPSANLLRFLRHMARDGVAVFGAELVLPNQPPLTKDYPKWTRIKLDTRSQILWQKEAAINAVAKQLPPEFTNIAWVDADLFFANPQWSSAVESALEEHDVVQCFDWAKWTARDGTIETTKQACAIVGLDHRWLGHPGFAWAMRRSLWERVGGLFDRTLSGGGDTVMTLAMMGLPVWDHAQRHLGANQTLYRKWAANFSGVRVGHVPGSVFHEWHGTRQDRDYVGRCLRVSAVDAEHHLQLAPNKCLQWTAHADGQIVREVADYFKTRKEDG